VIFDFKCPSGHIFEANTASSVRTVPCKDCASPAERQISTPLVKLPFTGDYPGAALKWARYHEQGAQKTAKD
jgi:hypothetical protein